MKVNTNCYAQKDRVGSNLLSELNVAKQEHGGIISAELRLQTVLMKVLRLQQLNFQEVAVNNVIKNCIIG